MTLEDERPEEVEVAENSRAPISNMEAGLAVLVAVAVLAITIYFGIAQSLVALLMFPGIPLVLAWFVYWLFLRRLIRMRRIRGARERRLMREAAERGRTSK